MAKFNFKTAKKKAITVAMAAVCGGFYTGHAIANLFYDGSSTPVQGAWYDYQDLNGMYQDYGGQSPVTAVGQPVGLVLDKRYNFRRGNSLSAPTYATSAPADNVTTVTSTTSFSQTAGTTASRTYLNFTAAGIKAYEISFTVASLSAGTVSLQLRSIAGGQGTVFDASPNMSAGQTYTGILHTDGTDAACINWVSSNVGAFATITGISVKPIPGNHRKQATSTARAILSALYNRLQKTDQLTDSYWTKACSNGTAVPVVTDNYAANPLGVQGTNDASRIQLTLPGDGEWALVRRTNVGLTIKANEIWKQRLWVKATDAGQVGKKINLYTYNATTLTYNEVAKITLTSEWQPIVNNATFTADSNSQEFSIGKARNGVSNGLLNAETATDFLVWGPDFRTSADAALSIPAYQRVTSSTDYDTNGFPTYLDYDGTDDSAASQAIDFSGTDEITVITGLGKRSDAATGMVLELTTNSTTTAGSFGLLAPSAASNADFQFRSGGSQPFQPKTVGSVAAPYLAVLAGTADISADNVNLRVNAIAGVPTTTDQGTGNYSNAVLYEGSRAGSSLRFNGRIYGQIVIAKALPEFRLKQAEKHMARKMGLVI